MNDCFVCRLISVCMCSRIGPEAHFRCNNGLGRKDTSEPGQVPVADKRAANESTPAWLRLVCKARNGPGFDSARRWATPKSSQPLRMPASYPMHRFGEQVIRGEKRSFCCQQTRLTVGPDKPSPAQAALTMPTCIFCCYGLSDDPKLRDQISSRRSSERMMKMIHNVLA